MPDLFEFLRDNAPKSQELPSEQAWKKLERRLEKRRRKSRGIRFLQVWNLVLTLLILLMAAVLVWLFLRMQGG